MGPAIVIALGSNLGDRPANLNRAARLLDCAGVRTLRRSRLYLTRPLGGMQQPAYLNAALLIQTRWSPLTLLRICRSVEMQMGRRRDERWAPRIIDIDLIFYGAARVDHPELSLPHPRWKERDFILRELLDLRVVPPVLEVHRIADSPHRLLPDAEATVESARPWL